MNLRDMAKEAAYQSSRPKPRNKKPGHKDILSSLFDTKYEPMPPDDVPGGRPPSASFSSGEGRGNSGMDELKVTSADRAFLDGMVAGFLEKMAFAPMNALYNIGQRLQPAAFQDSFADGGALKKQFPNLAPKKSLMGHAFGSVPLAGGLIGAAQSSMQALTGRSRPHYQGISGPR